MSSNSDNSTRDKQIINNQNGIRDKNTSLTHKKIKNSIGNNSCFLISNQHTVDCNNIPPSTRKDCVIYGYPKPNMPRM